mmetsp:Transcript_7034/g.13906  ORF Transcript_7034/g.13906 Transcript_7034/m.13906 type:complete len:230 (+) Transcript_7034:846-1535(+)
MPCCEFSASTPTSSRASFEIASCFWTTGVSSTKVCGSGNAESEAFFSLSYGILLTDASISPLIFSETVWAGSGMVRASPAPAGTTSDNSRVSEGADDGSSSTKGSVSCCKSTGPGVSSEKTTSCRASLDSVSVFSSSNSSLSSSVPLAPTAASETSICGPCSSVTESSASEISVSSISLFPILTGCEVDLLESSLTNTDTVHLSSDSAFSSQGPASAPTAPFLRILSNL